MNVVSIKQTRLEQQFALYKGFRIMIRESAKKQFHAKMAHCLPLNNLYRIRWMKSSFYSSDFWEIYVSADSCMNLGVDDGSEAREKFALMRATGSPLYCADFVIVKRLETVASFYDAGRVFERTIAIPQVALEKKVATLQKECAPFLVGCYELGRI